MLHGAHMPNAALTQDDLCRFRLGGFNAAKLMWYHGEREVEELRGIRSDVHVMVRLADTGPYHNDLAACVRGWADTVRRFSALGVTCFQVDNEPQLQVQWADRPWIWRWYVEQAMVGLERAVAGEVGEYDLVLTPLAYAPLMWSSLPLWRSLLVWRDHSNPEHRSLAERVRYAGANCYWQSNLRMPVGDVGRDRQMMNMWLGRAYADVYALTGKQVVVCEWANSLTDLVPRPDAGVVRAEMARSYPLYVEQLRRELTPGGQPMVVAAYMYILGGTGEWAGFWPDDRTLRLFHVE